MGMAVPCGQHNNPALELIGIAKVPSSLPLAALRNRQWHRWILGMPYGPVVLGQAPSLI
jgi:hypothetical protein